MLTEVGKTSPGAKAKDCVNEIGWYEDRGEVEMP